MNSGEYDAATNTWSNPPSAFRVYNSPTESVFDFGRLLSGDRYNGINNALDLKSAVSIMSRGGYATDPGYIGKILNIAKQYDLTKYDPKPGQARAIDTNNDGIFDFMLANPTDYKIIQTGVAPPMPPLPNDDRTLPSDWYNPQDRTDPSSPYYNPNGTDDNATGLTPEMRDHMNGVDTIWNKLKNSLWFVFAAILLIFGIYFLFKEPFTEQFISKGAKP
jgi:hypothetical protein